VKQTTSTLRLLTCLTLFAVCCLSASLTFAQQGIVTTVERDLTLRVGAGTQWRQLTIMPVGTTIALDGRVSDNSWVRGISQNGDVGWMFAQYLAASPQQLSSLPIIAREAPITVSAPAAGAVQAAPAGRPAADTPAASAPQTATVPAGGVQASATANVNMRSGPSTEFNRVGGVRFQQPITLDGRDPQISWVRGVNSDGTVGWVSVQYTDLSYDQAASLPIVEPGSPFGLAVPAGQDAAAEQQAAPVNVNPVVSTAPVRGFSYGGHIVGFSGPTVNAMRQAGMTWVKKQVRYNQGDNPGGAIGLINQAHGLGFRVVLGVVGAPNQVNNPGYDDAYAGFVAGLAAAGADAIEIWNEPNLDREWPTGQVDPGRYTQLLARSYNAIKGANPNTLVISGAPAPTGFFGGCAPQGCDDLAYIQGMAAAGAGNFADCIGAHYNEGIVPPSQNSNDPRGDSYYTRFFDGMVNTYYNVFRKPICFTELGYLTPEGYGPLPGAFGWAGNVTVAQQAAWLDQAMARAARSGRVRLVIVWNVDFTNYGGDPMAGYAIIRPGGGCPACAALGN
jgi:uncharacterized protein YraI